MPGGYDVRFCRILWVSLVAVGLTFTAILTTVFVDIDALLAKRSRAVPNPEPKAIKPGLSSRLEEFQDYPQTDDSDEMDSVYRIKRSLESGNLLFHIKSPRMKKIITNRLATLLEELDEEESSQNGNTKGLAYNKIKNVEKPTLLSADDAMQNGEDNQHVRNEHNYKLKKELSNKDIFHLAMHNILLQGIIGHMDLNDVYNKVHQLVKSFENHDDNGKEIQELIENKPTELMKIISQDSYNEENKFFDELLKCQKLQKQILQNKELKSENKNETTEDSPVLIKTVIEITNKRMDEKHANLNRNIKGLVKLLYNGKPIQFKELPDNKDEGTITVNNLHQNIKDRTHKVENKELSTVKSNADQENYKNPDLDQAIAEYLKAHSVKIQNNHNLLTKESFETKRLKRQIKIHYLNDGVTTEKSKLKEKLKRHEEELFVEIETHFDGKGKKGEKKKKLVRSLIDKIQKAINSNIDVLQDNNNETRVQIKKRPQNSLHHKKELVNTPTVEPVEHRQLNPISKTANIMQSLTSVLEKYGENWKRMHDGPGFLAVSKSLNSAEMSEVDIDYNSVMKNGIPKRLQRPLNIKSEDVIEHDFSNMGNVTLFLKEIDGSGFSVGINQYTDEPPDKDSLNIFTGLENLIQAYHEQYDQTETDALGDSEDKTDYTGDSNHEMVKRDINNHKRGAINVKLFSNLKTKTKLNRFLNTNPMQTKKIFLKSKRNKRHIDKIRIVASDHYPRSNENVFLVSHEDVFADRAIVKGDDPPEVEIGDKNDEHYDFIAPYGHPYNSDVPNFQSYIGSAYDTQSLQSGLMSKYPHVFVENVSKSKEQVVNIRPINNEHDGTEIVKTHKYRKFDAETIMHANDKSRESKISAPNLDEIVSAILPPESSYKLTVNILPKNITNTGPEYKEVHKSINKSYDKNGVRYVSSVNVSEISKFENVNKTTEENVPTTKSQANEKIERQQSQIKLLLKLHKMRIDHQLEHLRIESQKLNQMIGKEDKENWIKNMSNIIDVFKHLGLKDLDDKIGSSKPYGNHTSNSEILLKSRTPIKPLIENVQEDTEKNNLINTIKQNENITREILQKIDKNTDVLQSFLQKMSEKISPENSVRALDAPKYLSPFIGQLHTNLTNSIPFIYAFQKPILNNEKSIKNVASVVYHGHLHANRIENSQQNNDYLKDVQNNVKIQGTTDKIKDFNTKKLFNNNESRFFIDELENNFKIVPIVNDNSIKVNMTV